MVEDYKDLTSDNLMENLIERVAKKEHTKAELIRTRDGLAAAKVLSTALFKISKMFDKLAKQSLEKYIEEIDDTRMQLNAVQQLCTYRDFLACKRFYLVEKGIIDRIIYEYNVYVNSGHLIDSMLGNERPEEDLYDYTK